MPDAAGADRGGHLLPNMRLDDLLAELQNRLEAVLAARDRVHALLEAVVAVGSDLDLKTTLRRLVETATTLLDARYGALGVVGEGDAGGRLVQFIPVGLSEEEIRAIEHWPHGLGILGLLIKDPHLLRLSDISEHPESYGFPSGHPPMRSFIGMPIRVRDEVFGNLYLTEKRGGGQFDEEDEIVLTALATAAGVAIENARLYDEGRRRERWLEASSEVTRALLSGTPPEEVLCLVARRAREVTDADIAVVGLPAGNVQVEVAAADGVGAEEIRGLRLDAAGTLLGQVLGTGEPREVADLREEHLAMPSLARRLALSSALLVPLGCGQQTRGVLAVGNRAGSPPFTAATQQMMHAFAGQAAVALELAERRRDAERLVVLEDRDRIAKDLHDVVIQRLFATAITLSGAGRLIEKPEAAARVHHAVDDLDETIREIRSTIFALQTPPEQAPADLRTRVLAAVDAAAEALGFTPGLQLEGLVDTAVPEPIGEQLLAVLREALSNAARHAQARRVSVLVDAAEALTLRVEDDGVGIPAAGRRSGLRNLAERAEALGGEFAVRPREQGGTVLEWRVPLAKVGPDDG